MCWLLILAADRPLPVVPPTTPPSSLSVTALSGSQAIHFPALSKPHRYDVGSATGCACGFNRDLNNPSHPEEQVATDLSLVALGEYLQDAVAISPSMEIYTCWDGDEGTAPAHTISRSPHDFRSGMAWFLERTIITVQPSAA